MINPKNKGQSFEYEIRDSLRKIDPKVRRSVMSGAIGKTLRSEQGDIATSLGLCIECKRTEKLKPYEFYQQAVEENENKNKIPIVVMRSNNKEALTLLSWKDFLNIYENSLLHGFIKRDLFPKPEKPKKLSPEDQNWQPFSKANQARRAKQG